MSMRRGLTSWGRLDQRSRSVAALTRTALPKTEHSALAYGMGRSYGDSCLNDDGCLWLSAGLDRFLDFDSDSGVLHVESGVTLGQIQTTLQPLGWSLAVVPGTQFVTVGGAIANDVHGKNHHDMGSFCDHVLDLELWRSDGTQMICGPAQAPEWFAATAGGLGLTGVIMRARLQLRRISGPWLDVETVPFRGLEAFFDLAETGAWENTVAWIDCLSGEEPNGLFMRANPAADQTGIPSAPAPKTVPFTPPISAINAISLRVFNALYLHFGRKNAGQKRVDYQRFHHPLDSVQGWNRLYGPKGFYQYQCVIPNAARLEATKDLLRTIRRAGQGSFLVVLKTFGARPPVGMLSFVQEGVTLALDFPNRGNVTRKLLDDLDQIVLQAGGRLYPAKDARMSAAMFRSGYPNLDAFLPFRDPGLASNMSRRLIGD